MTIKILATLVLVAQISLPLLLAGLLLIKKQIRVFKFFEAAALPLAFLVALVSMLGSLYLSEIAGFAPCDLCWYQRIFMYPQVFLLGLAWYRKEHVIINYSLLLAAIGFAISIYHNYIVYQALTQTFCSLDAKVSCTEKYITVYGYISIPLMALTGFATILILLYGKKLVEKFK
ncbi:disulfide bond formation protein B [Candidatus Falkowbacteria bacterium]|nr:disulfide bond formation protein B [Candidatus Falkowbacteria bacterium]